MSKIVKSNSSVEESLETRELKRTILEKERTLVTLLEEIEQLRVDLSIIKQEFDIKVGRLYLRLDGVDLEILRYKEIEDLLSKGFSFDEAQKIVDENLRTRREQINDRHKKLDEEEMGAEHRALLSKDIQAELKRLWRKLARQYHPDLTHGDDAMMKKVNKAYADGDLETLQAIDREYITKNTEGETLEELKRKLAKLSASIEKANGEHHSLQESEWYRFMQSMEIARGQNRDLLHELSEKILTDVARKENQLAEIKKKYGRG